MANRKLINLGVALAAVTLIGSYQVRNHFAEIPAPDVTAYQYTIDQFDKASGMLKDSIAYSPFVNYDEAVDIQANIEASIALIDGIDFSSFSRVYVNLENQKVQEKIIGYLEGAEMQLPGTMEAIVAADWHGLFLDDDLSAARNDINYTKFMVSAESLDIIQQVENQNSSNKRTRNFLLGLATSLYIAAGSMLLKGFGSKASDIYKGG